jgi:hypothetical protein
MAENGNFTTTLMKVTNIELKNISAQEYRRWYYVTNRRTDMVSTWSVSFYSVKILKMDNFCSCELTINYSVFL